MASPKKKDEPTVADDNAEPVVEPVDSPSDDVAEAEAETGEAQGNDEGNGGVDPSEPSPSDFEGDSRGQGTPQEAGQPPGEANVDIVNEGDIDNSNIAETEESEGDIEPPDLRRELPPLRAQFVVHATNANGNTAPVQTDHHIESYDEALSIGAEALLDGGVRSFSVQKTYVKA